MKNMPETALDSDNCDRAHGTRHGFRFMAIVSTLVVGLAIVGWLSADSTSATAANGHAAIPAATSPAQGDRKAASVGSLLAGLEARLAENPDDAKGWLLLAKSQDHLGNVAAAREAYGRAKALGMEDLKLEARLNESWLKGWQPDTVAAGDAQ